MRASVQKVIDGSPAFAARIGIVALCIALTCACHHAESKAAKPPEPTFDGTQMVDVAALRGDGERLTHVLGCTGCHGDHLQGDQFEPEKKQYGPLYASNLTVEVPEYTDAQLDGILRRGTHPTRGTVWVMPSEIFQHLSDSDERALFAYLRSLKPIGKRLPPPHFSAVDRKEISSGEFKSALRLVNEQKHQLPRDAGPQYELGRYITEITCAECHGPKLEGKPGRTPDLVVAGGYSRGEFERLITQGIPTGNRVLKPMMSGVAKYRFSHLTKHERDALYEYLQARAGQPQ